MTTNDENIHIGEFFKQVFGYWKIYVPIGVICLLGAVVFLLVTPKEYTVNASMQLLGEKQGMMSELKMIKSSGFGGLLGGGGGSVNVEDEIILMRSKNVLEKVINQNSLQVVIEKRDGFKWIELDIDESPIAIEFPYMFLQSLAKPIKIDLKITNGDVEKMIVRSDLFEKIELSNQSLPMELKLPIGKFAMKENLPLSGKFVINIYPLQYIYEELLKNITIYPNETISDIVVLSQQSSNIRTAGKLLNNLMDQYNLYSRSVKISESDLNSAFVKTRLDTITHELAILEHQIENYKQLNKMPDPMVYASVTYSGNKETEKMILEAETRLRMLDYVVKYMSDSSNEYSAIPIIDGAGEKTIAIYNQLLLDRQRLLLSSESNNPALLLVEKQLREQRKMLLESVKSVSNNLKISLDALYKKDTSLSRQVDLLPTKEREFIELKRQQKIKETIFLFLMQKLQEKELINSPDEIAGRIVDKSYSSYKHIFPKISMVLIVALGIAFMLSLIIISFKMFVLKRKS